MNLATRQPELDFHGAPGDVGRDIGRYSQVALALHWLIGLALLVQITFGFLLDDIAPRGTPARGDVINLHKSIGVVLGLFIVARLLWRLTHPAPAWPRSLPAWQQQAARLGHRALYTCMLTMPLSGYIGSNFSARGVLFFGHRWPAWGPDLPAVYRLLNGLHVVTGWIFCFLIAGHILMAAKHGLIDRDGVFSRMWPESSPQNPPL